MKLIPMLIFRALEYSLCRLVPSGRPGPNSPPIQNYPDAPNLSANFRNILGFSGVSISRFT